MLVSHTKIFDIVGDIIRIKVTSEGRATKAAPA